MGNHGYRWGNLGVRWVTVVTLDLKGDVSRTGWTEDAVVTMVLTDGIQGRSGNHGDDEWISITGFGIPSKKGPSFPRAIVDRHGNGYRGNPGQRVEALQGNDSAKMGEASRL